MKISQQIILRVFFGLSVAGLLSGCTIPRDNMAKSTTEYNLVVEKAQNEMLLLNIVRASKRRPRYFTSFNLLRGSMTYDFQIGSISIPFGGGSDEKYSIMPSLRYSTNPLFDLTVQDSQAFTQGIMTPVPMKTIEYYWHQGWPKEMLLHLFIYSIEANDVNGNKVLVKNYPDDRDEFQKFQKKLKIVDLDIVEVNDPNVPKDLPVKTKFVFKPKDKTDANDYKVYIRSPETILYYLGEILRVENRKKDPYTPMIDFGDEQPVKHTARLFYARKVTTNDSNDIAPCVSVNYEGVRYVIPQAPDSDDGYCTDRSMTVLTLVSQLIGLQKESKVAPVTGVVSIIGGR